MNDDMKKKGAFFRICVRKGNINKKRYPCIQVILPNYEKFIKKFPDQIIEDSISSLKGIELQGKIKSPTRIINKSS